MNKVMKAWLLRLIDEETKQETKQLYNVNTGGFCCLGDLCEVAGLEFRLGDYNYKESVSSHYLPDQVTQDFLGFTKENSTVILENSLGASFYHKGNKCRFSPSYLNDLELPKSVIGVLIWAILIQGPASPLQYLVRDIYYKNEIKGPNDVIYGLVPTIKKVVPSVREELSYE